MMVLDFLLIFIDSFSKYLRKVALKQKTAAVVLNGIQQVFESGVQCKKLRSDRGSEFRNNLLRNYLQKNEFVCFLPIKIQRLRLQKELLEQFAVDCIAIFKKKQNSQIYRRFV